jgi:hypothetical protein
MSKPLNITFEILDTEATVGKKPVTFYHIDALTVHPSGSYAVIISGGKEWIATATYEEIWEKLKKHLDEIAT